MFVIPLDLHQNLNCRQSDVRGTKRGQVQLTRMSRKVTRLCLHPLTARIFLISSHREWSKPLWPKVFRLCHLLNPLLHGAQCDPVMAAVQEATRDQE